MKEHDSFDSSLSPFDQLFVCYDFSKSEPKGAPTLTAFPRFSFINRLEHNHLEVANLGCSRSRVTFFFARCQISSCDRTNTSKSCRTQPQGCVWGTRCLFLCFLVCPFINFQWKLIKQVIRCRRRRLAGSGLARPGRQLVAWCESFVSLRFFFHQPPLLFSFRSFLFFRSKSHIHFYYVDFLSSPFFLLLLQFS